MSTKRKIQDLKEEIEERVASAPETPFHKEELLEGAPESPYVEGVEETVLQSEGSFVITSEQRLAMAITEIIGVLRGASIANRQALDVIAEDIEDLLP